MVVKSFFVQVDRIFIEFLFWKKKIYMHMSLSHSLIIIQRKFRITKTTIIKKKFYIKKFVLFSTQKKKKRKCFLKVILLFPFVPFWAFFPPFIEGSGTFRKSSRGMQRCNLERILMGMHVTSSWYGIMGTRCMIHSLCTAQSHHDITRPSFISF